MVPLGGIFATSMLSGLGEAMDGLPIALAALGHRCMVISPRSLGLECWKDPRGSEPPLAMFRLRPVQGGLGHGLLELRAHGRQERVGALLPHLQAEGPLPQQHGLASLGCCWGSFELAGRLRLRRSPDLPGARQRTYRPGESAEMHRQTSVPASLGSSGARHDLTGMLVCGDTILRALPGAKLYGPEWGQDKPPRCIVGSLSR